MAKKQDKADDAPDFLGDGFDEYSGTNPNLPEFGVGGNIFTTPTDLLGGAATTIGADAASGFLSGAAPTFTAPATSISFGAPGSMAPGGMSLGDLINPWAQRTDITQLAPNWGDWVPERTTTAKDFEGFKVSQDPYNNLQLSGAQARTDVGSDVTTTASSDVVTMDRFKVNETTGPGFMVDPSQFAKPSVFGGPEILGGVNTSTADTGAVQLDPVVVEATKTGRPPVTTTTVTPTTGATGGSTTGYSVDESGAIVLDPVKVTETRIQPNLGTLDWDKYQQDKEKAWNAGAPIQLPPVKVTPTDSDTTDKGGTVIRQTGTANTDPILGLDDIKRVGPVPDTTIKKDDGVTTNLPPTNTNIPSTTQTGTTSTTTTTTSSAMTERDLKAELEKTMAAFDQYRPRIQQMYGDLYSQFMPKGITAAEPGIINQYQQDLARLQQRQAGMLSPEDIRQSQQSAREAYGARGQVMGPGAIGAEILNREAIRQQREDQARAALQASYGNVLNMANLQTGNLFSPIASLMSSTFNPLGAYPADVYGTNVNAQLARDIAQQNKEAAIRSAELAGAAGRQAATTSAAGQIGSAALPTIFSWLASLCWVAREVYGENNPKWLQFREWLMTRSPSWFFNFYLENGEKIAAWLKRNPWAKRPIRMWMDSRIRSMEKREMVLKEAV